MNKTIVAHAALLAVAFIYGGNYSIAKLVLDDHYIGPSGFILLRVVFGCILFWLTSLLIKKESVNWAADGWRIVGCAMTGVAINQLAFFNGLKLTTPINASLIMVMTPIIVISFSALLGMERITPKKTIGILLGAFGAALLITKGDFLKFQLVNILGDVLIFVNATVYGLYLILVKQLMSKYQPITIVKWVFTIGIVFVLPFGYDDLVSVEWGTFNRTIWAATIFVLLGTTYMAYLFNAFALSKLKASIVGIYIYLQPLIATAIALALQKDALNGLKIIAGSLICLGVFLVSNTRKSKNALK